MHIAHAQSHNKVSKTTQATSENTIILFVCPPKFCISIVTSFSCDLQFRILRTHFVEWRILNAQRITDFFNISAWIMDFVCFEVRIAEINLAICFNIFLPDLRTSLDYSGYQ